MSLLRLWAAVGVRVLANVTPVRLALSWRKSGVERWQAGKKVQTSNRPRCVGHPERSFMGSTRIMNEAACAQTAVRRSQIPAGDHGEANLADLASSSSSRAT